MLGLIFMGVSPPSIFTNFSWAKSHNSKIKIHRNREHLIKLATSTEYKRDMFFNTKSNPEFRVKKTRPISTLGYIFKETLTKGLNVATHGPLQWSLSYFIRYFQLTT